MSLICSVFHYGYFQKIFKIQIDPLEKLKCSEAWYKSDVMIMAASAGWVRLAFFQEQTLFSNTLL